MYNPNVIIIHGAYGYPQENWFGWLKRELEFLNVACQVPQLPTPVGQNLECWIQEFNRSCKQWIHPNTILIGHSLGAAFILKWLEHHKCKVKAVILVGAFWGDIGVKKFDDINQSFFQETLNWSKILERTRQFICYHGENDPYVYQYQLDYFVIPLGAQKIIISNGGHLNAAAGYQKFPQLLIFLKHLMEIFTYD